MREVMRHIARDAMGLPHDAPVPSTVVRSYMYQDGRAIVRLRLTPEMIPEHRKRRMKPEDVDLQLRELGDSGAWSMFSEGTWFEGSFLYLPGQGRDYKVRYEGLQQIQSFGSRHAPTLFETLRFIVLPKMTALGYPAPQEYLLRAGFTIDESLPFTKKDPPV